jgi:hypothetical protein
MAKIDNGGPAFPTERFDNAARIEPDGYHGMSLRDWFATYAPMPSDDEILTQLKLDAARNPHNEHRKPKRRSRYEIIADLKFEHADAMLSARKKEAGT